MQRMQNSGPRAFLGALNDSEKVRLFAFAEQAVEPSPPTLLQWYCGSQLLGLISRERADWLMHHLTSCRAAPHGLVWDALRATREQRSEQLQGTLLQARSEGLLPGWLQQMPLQAEQACFFRQLALQTVLHALAAGQSTCCHVVQHAGVGGLAQSTPRAPQPAIGQKAIHMHRMAEHAQKSKA